MTTNQPTVEYEVSTSEGRANITIRKTMDGSVTWAMSIPVATADLAGFEAAVELARQVDAKIAETFRPAPRRRTGTEASASPRWRTRPGAMV